MNNRYITLTIFGLLLFIFTIYFIVQKTNFPSRQPLRNLFQDIIQDAKRNEWTKALAKADRIKTEWEKRKYLIMLNYAEADYQVLNTTVSQLIAGAQTKNQYKVASLAKVGRTLWENCLKVIPEP